MEKSTLHLKAADQDSILHNAEMPLGKYVQFEHYLICKVNIVNSKLLHISMVISVTSFRVEGFSNAIHCVPQLHFRSSKYWSRHFICTPFIIAMQITSAH